MRTIIITYLLFIIVSNCNAQNSAPESMFPLSVCANGTAAISPTTVCSGSTVTLSVSGLSGTATSYQWQQSTDNGVTWTNIAGGTTKTFTTSARTYPNSYSFRILSSGSCTGTGISSVVSITPAATPTTATAGTNQTLSCSTTTATLTGNTPTYGTGTWTVVSGTATITSPSTATSGITGLAGTAVLKWTIANSPCTSSSSTVTITNNQAVGGTATATNCTYPYLSLANYSGSSLQWQMSIDNVNFDNISGATTSGYTVRGLSAGTTYYFRALVTSATCGTTAYSTTVSYTPPQATYAYYTSNPLPTDYATASAAGTCYNNLQVGKTYCFYYTDVLPSSGSGSYGIAFYTNGCASCSMSARGTSSGTYSSSVCATASTSTGGNTCGENAYYGSTCDYYQSNKIVNGIGNSCSFYTKSIVNCITVPAGCNNMSICPIMYCGGGNCQAPLPIKLLYFKAFSSNNKVELRWSTETEINNNYFLVERSRDGLFFEPVTVIKGAGNSSIVLNYEATDGDAYEGVSYYRLTQYDYDGASASSPIISVSKEDDDFFLPLCKSENISVLFYSNNSTSAEIIIYDAVGKKLFDRTENFSSGFQNVTVPADKISSGIVFVTLALNGKQSTKRVLISSASN